MKLFTTVQLCAAAKYVEQLTYLYVMQVLKQQPEDRGGFSAIVNGFMAGLFTSSVVFTGLCIWFAPYSKMFHRTTAATSHRKRTDDHHAASTSNRNPYQESLRAQLNRSCEKRCHAPCGSDVSKMASAIFVQEESKQRLSSPPPGTIVTRNIHAECICPNHPGCV